MDGESDEVIVISALGLVAWGVTILLQCMYPRL